MHNPGVPATWPDLAPPTGLQSQLGSGSLPKLGAPVCWGSPAPVGTYRHVPVLPAWHSGKMSEWLLVADSGCEDRYRGVFPGRGETPRSGSRPTLPATTATALCPDVLRRTGAVDGRYHDKPLSCWG